MQIQKMVLIIIKQREQYLYIEKKHSNTLYTINALNECIKNLNNGVLDNKFIVPWENFKNMLMVTNSEGLNKINTRIFKIIKID